MKKPAIRRTAEAADLVQSLQTIADGLEDKLIVLDSEYRVRFANSAVCQSCENTESPVDKRCYEVFQGRDKPCGPPLWECPLGKVVRNASPATLVHPYRNRYVKITMWPLKDSHGNTDAVVELRRDVTAEREREREILRRHHHLDSLSHVSSAVSGLGNLPAILNVALDTVLQIFSGSVGGILLFDEKVQKLCYKVHRGLSAKYAGEMCLTMGEGIAGKVAQTGEPILLEDISRNPDVTLPALINAEGLKGFISVPLKAKEKVVGVMNIASHLAGKFALDDMYLLNSIACQLGTAIEQAKLNTQLSQGRKRYQMLLRQALNIQEQERKRIARELHDETSQQLTALTLNLQAVNEMIEMGNLEDAEIKEMLKKTQSIAVHAGNEVNKLIRELRPTLLDTLGLPAAIHHLADANFSSQGINVSTEFQGMERRLPAESELALFRISQEAMSNILRHSGARNAAVKIECDADKCVLRVEDDGKGFDVSEITSIDRRGRGAGLFGMKERVKLVGGICSINSHLGKGTKITAKIPLIRSAVDAEDKGISSG
ncbi:MAG: GAF domain-containing protein [Dehalococcoidia bacterium]|nr:GAF domain-containing protein [Dehalococcoidia bacterium]